MKKVIITGILGQDGSNLADYIFSLPEQYFVYGVYKRGSNPNVCNLGNLVDNPNFKLVSGDITDPTSMDNLVSGVNPDYFINFAANSFVGNSWDTPEQIFNANTIGVLRCLEAIRKFAPHCRFYSAGSSEEFGEILFTPQTEDHPLLPVSPYAAAKIAARHMVSIYRKSYGMFAIHGTLYNHEGPRRGTEFVTRKITKEIARISYEIENELPVTPFKLGNVHAMKDWSDSRDMVRGIWLMLNNRTPEEFILASNKTRSIKQFVESAFKAAGLPGVWVTNPNLLKDYFSINVNGNETTVITIDPKLFRPTEVGTQQGDYSKAKKALGWEPLISFDQMVKEMVDNDKRLIG